jgi:8-amino-7-oxononanoate synthase
MLDNPKTQPGIHRRETDIPVAAAPKSRRSQDHWLERWTITVGDLARLRVSHPMLDAVIDEQRGRQIRIGERWLTDWASCNYLGFDLDEEIIAAIPDYLARHMRQLRG